MRTCSWQRSGRCAPFGGLGSRARRGFGTLGIVHPPRLEADSFDPGWLVRDDHGDLADVLGCVRKAMAVLLGGSPLDPVSAPPTPRYPCFREGAFEVADERLARSWERSLKKLGEDLRAFRLTEDGQQQAATYEYREIVRPFLDGNTPPIDAPFILGALGLPVGFSDGPAKARRKATVLPVLDGKEIRRASPLWLRVRRQVDGDVTHWHVRSLALLAEWLPDGARLRLRGQGRRPAPVGKPDQADVDALLRDWFDARPNGGPEQ
jgi:hypothetical protein